MSCPMRWPITLRTIPNLGVVLRFGGDLDLIKRFLAAGYPVLVEKGTYLHDLTGVVSWMGHYQVITGYDEAGGYFITQDSFVGADHQVKYEDMLESLAGVQLHLPDHLPERS